MNERSGSTNKRPELPGVLQSLSPEVRAIIAGVRGQIPTESDLDWDLVGRLAVVHGVAPLLHQAWSNASGPVPEALLTELQQLRRQSGLYGALGLCQRDEVLQILEQEGIPCLVLKGAALARTWYGDLSLRPFVDIDLWVTADKLAHAHAALLRVGYHESGRPRTGHHGVPLHKEGLPCAVEIHHRITSLPLRQSPSFAEFDARAITLPLEGSPLRSLSAEDTLLHLCLHVLEHMEPSQGWRLRHLCDIARHIQTFEIDWQVFAHQTEVLGVRASCGAALGLAALVAQAEVPGELTDEAAIELIPYPLPGLKDHHFLGAFLATLRRAELSRAWAMLRTVMGGPEEGHTRLQDLRPQLLLPFVGNLVTESIMRPDYLRGQLRLWVSEAEHRDQRSRAVRALFSAEQTTQNTPASSRADSARGSGSRPVVLLSIAVLLGIVLRSVLKTIRVRGTSMEPTLHAGERLVVDTFTYQRRPPHRGDIVLLKNPSDQGRMGIKRVVGLPGELVAIKRGRVMIDGRRLEEAHQTIPGTYTSGPVHVPPKSYFVLGDNRRTSVDSHVWGAVPQSRIIGRVLMSYWPRFRRF